MVAGRAGSLKEGPFPGVLGLQGQSGVENGPILGPAGESLTGKGK